MNGIPMHSESKVKGLEWLLRHLLPRHCVACGTASGERNLCPVCLAGLPRISHGCTLCGISLSLKSDAVCGVCLNRNPPWRQGIAALDYCFPVRQLVCRFKFQRDFASGQVLGQELLAMLARTAPPLPDSIIPVPLHRLRHFKRTFNQAEVLARQMAGGLQLPLDYTSLRRVRGTAAQSGLNASERKKNIRGAFVCNRLRHEHVALVDDVMTTGTTLAECARAVRRAGAHQVSVWVVARANIP